MEINEARFNDINKILMNEIRFLYDKSQRKEGLSKKEVIVLLNKLRIVYGQLNMPDSVEVEPYNEA